MFDDVLQEVRYALRALRSSPGFAAIAILSLALGIGANTAIFSLINAVILKTLPVSHPEQLVQLVMKTEDGTSFTNPIWEQVRDRQDVFFHGLHAPGLQLADVDDHVELPRTLVERPLRFHGFHDGQRRAQWKADH